MPDPPARVGADHAPHSKMGRDALKALLVFTLAVVIFMWQPLGTGNWSAAGDMAGLSEILTPPQSDGLHDSHFDNQIDVTVDILPWLEFNASQLRSGHLPLWNPYNNSGVPHLGNLQSAVFSPFSVPFYILPMQWALLVSAYLVLVTAAMTTYGLMRHLGVGHLAGIASATVYMFNSFIVQWFRWPLADVASLLPAILWATSALVQASGRREILRRGAVTALVIAVGILAGHPETIFFGMFPAALWSGFWLFRHRSGARDTARRIVTLAITGVAALGLAAVQLLPFLEYLRLSPASVARDVQVFQSARWGQVQVFPLFAGSPASAYTGPYGLSNPFHEIVVFYVGIFALALAGIGVVSGRWTGRRTQLVFAGAAAGCLVYAYDIAGLGRLVSRLPVLSGVMPSRVAPVWSLCIAILVGFGFDALGALTTGKWRRSRWAVITVVGVVAGVTAIAAYRAWRFTVNSDFATPQLRDTARSVLVHHTVFIAVTLLSGLSCGFAYVRSRHPGVVRRIGAIGMIVVLFLQGGFLFRNHNPSVAGDRFMKPTTTVERIAAKVGDNQTLWVGRATLPPDVNLAVPTYSPDNYDVMGIRTYDRIYRAVLRPREIVKVGGAQVGLLTGPYDPVSTTALGVLGIRRIVTARDHPFYIHAGTVTPDAADRSTAHYQWPLFEPTGLALHTTGIADGTTVVVRVDDSGGHDGVSVQARVFGGLVFVEVPEGIARTGTVTIGRAHDALPEAARITGGQLIWTHVGGLELVGSVDGYHIFGVPGPDGFVHSPPTATSVPDHAAAIARTEDPDFDPTNEVVVENPASVDTTSTRHEDGGRHASPGVVTVRRFDPGHISIEVERDTAGYVVVDQNDFPGWTATVNGQNEQIFRANSAFMAVPVPAGTSEVTLTYRPESVRVGAWISVLTLVVVLVALGVGSTATRRRRRREAD